LEKGSFNLLGIHAIAAFEGKTKAFIGFNGCLDVSDSNSDMIDFMQHPYCSPVV
jgi:hypothetical protein